MTKTISRPKRWAAACENALNAIQAAKSDVEGALQDLVDLKSEYEEWRDNLPEMAQSAPVADKLNEIVDGIDLDIDIEGSSFSELEALIEEIAEADLPRGFGRD